MESSTESARTAGRTILAVAVALCAAGLGLSVELTRIHALTHLDPTFHSLCAVSEQVNCETVAQSPYSVALGLPISVWGLLAYVAMGFLACWGLTSRRLHPLWPRGLLALMFTLSLLVSLVLGAISFTRIDSMCLFCMGSYAVNLALFVLGALLVRRSEASPLALVAADLGALASRPVMAGAFGLCAAVVVAALMLAVPPYWEHPAWRDLPVLPEGVDGVGHHWIGAKSPKVTVVEFSDYECPHCRRAHKEMRLLAARRPDDVRLVHRHFPLDRACNPQVKRKFHERACEFARAAECAGEQDRFWAMNDALFSLQEGGRAEDLDPELVAVQLGLDRSAFVDCMSGAKARARVDADVAEAAKRGVAGTPTYFVGEQAYPGGIPLSVLEDAIKHPLRD
jgi:protein-disulfide isomerase/uncharacterized membrane protein